MKIINYKGCLKLKGCDAIASNNNGTDFKGTFDDIRKSADACNEFADFIIYTKR